MNKEHFYNYIITSVSGFMSDPPSTDFQRGYLAAVLETAESNGISTSVEPFSTCYKMLARPR